MSWQTTTLSTLLTIAEHEKEVNKQAPLKVRPSLYVPSTGSLSLAVDATINKAVFTYSDNTTATVSAALNAIAVPTAKYIIGIKLYDALNALLYTFDCGEGNGLTLTDQTDTFTMVMSGTSATTAWKDTKVDQTWQDKINLAKKMLGFDLENILVARQITVDEASGEVLLDVIQNPETLLIACDYKALALIYRDLSNAGFNELFSVKAKQYAALYIEELANAQKRMNIGTNNTVTEYRPDLTARVVR